MSKASDYIGRLFTELEKKREKWLNTSPENSDYTHEFIRYAECRAAYKAAMQTIKIVTEDLLNCDTGNV